MPDDFAQLYRQTGGSVAALVDSCGVPDYTIRYWIGKIKKSGQVNADAST